MPLRSDNRGTEHERVKLSLRVKQFLNMTPLEVEDALNTFITDAATAKEVVITLAMLLRAAIEEIKELKKS